MKCEFITCLTETKSFSVVRGRTFTADHIKNLSIDSVQDDFAYRSFIGCKFDDCRFLDSFIRYVNFNGCSFHSCTFGFVSFKKIDMSSCEFVNCYFIDCTFPAVDLCDTTFRNCNFVGCNLSGAKIDHNTCLLQSHYFILSDILLGNTLPHWRSVCPVEGSFIAYKKSAEGYIVKIEVPAKAKRVSPYESRKCRAEYAYVLDIYDPKTGEKKDAAMSWFAGCPFYKVGDFVRPVGRFDPSPTKICTSGIHFFMSEEEALEYEF